MVMMKCQSDACHVSMPCIFPAIQVISLFMALITAPYFLPEFVELVKGKKKICSEAISLRHSKTLLLYQVRPSQRSTVEPYCFDQSYKSIH